MSEASLAEKTAATSPAPPAVETAFGILLAISFCHLLPALYPMFKTSYQLSYAQIGLLTFTFQITASLLQPIIGSYTDRRARPYSLAAGMGFTSMRVYLKVGRPPQTPIARTTCCPRGTYS